jgi:predicted metallo-beta-lactamase superfamily hydrolase
MKKLAKIKVLPLAFESLGVRSMCTYVETPDIKILLDAGVSLGPNRYGFPPHPREYKALKDCRSRILEMAEKADVVTVSHYHFDHHTPSFTDWANNWSSAEIAEKTYAGKIVFAKSYKSKINSSQRQRGWMFHKTAGKKATRLEFADGKTFKFGETTIKFSVPVCHGEEGSELGWVLMITIEHKGEKMHFAPDVQGPMSDQTAKLILEEKPTLAVIGGPPVYLAEYKVTPEKIESAMLNLETIVENVPVTILDHHILRDENWTKNAQSAIDKASSLGHRILTAAEYTGEKNNLLEAQRKVLYETEPPSQKFVEWTKIPLQERKYVPPPIESEHYVY